MTPMRHTKMVATIGPSSSAPATIDTLIASGVDIFRLNFSHGTHEQHAAVIAELRDIAQHKGKPLALLQDLSGPKVRLGMFAAPSMMLKRDTGATIVSFKNPNCLSQISSMPPKIAVKTTAMATMPGARN